MNAFARFVQKEWFYILLLVFVVLLTFASAAPHDAKSAKPARTVDREDIFMKPEAAEKVLHEKPFLAAMFALASLLILASFLLGIIVDAILIRLRLSGGGFGTPARRAVAVKWGLWDVCRVAILFSFFGYMIVIMEAALLRSFPSIGNDNFRMILNSSVLDALAVVLILYFTVGQYRERLSSLGLSVKNFTKNVFYGAVGYLALVPPLIGTLAAIALVIHITKYVPERQPVVDLFLKERGTAFLAYTTVFAAFAGPVAEELFFRGFMYGALKKYIGIFWATMATAALFSALHTNVVGFLPIMVLGIALAYVYERTGTLVSSITLHTIHNFTMLLFVFLVKQLKG